MTLDSFISIALVVSVAALFVYIVVREFTFYSQTTSIFFKRKQIDDEELQKDYEVATVVEKGIHRIMAPLRNTIHYWQEYDTCGQDFYFKHHIIFKKANGDIVKEYFREDLFPHLKLGEKYLVHKKQTVQESNSY